ncbi:acyltransferase family protein [Butyrivibrio proteoclasticus]|uniref:acyltransferase family protein n=1 Tax=Butyrivibrio proteoclasticus TaxID=43305 RepID=UPI0004786C0C|nr:acyltransferase [Butyrivibrio proteoclasticus]
MGFIIGRKKWIDFLKGVAILLVVFQHSCASLFNSGISTEPILKEMVVGIGVFHMAIFFELAGYVFGLVYVKDGYLKDKKLIEQIANFFILYIGYSVLRFLIKIIFRNEANGKISLMDFLTIPVKAFDELWFLYVLIMIYLICIFAYKTQKKMIFFLLFVASVFCNILGIAFYYTSLLSMQYICFFIIGLFYYENETKCEAKSVLIIAEIVGLVICIFVFGSNCLKNEMIRNAAKLLIGCLICDILFFCAQKVTAECNCGKKHFIRTLCYLGENSLQIYLLHVYFTSGIRPIIKHLNIHWLLLELLLLFVGGVITPVVVGYVTKKIGLNKLFFHPIAYIPKKRNTIEKAANN